MSGKVRGKSDASPVSKWDERILRNKKRRKAELRRHIFQLIFAAAFLCVVLFCMNSMVSRAGTAKEEELSFKYYKNICIGQGETLTSIAERYADKEHYETFEQYVKEVVYMNHLKDADDICEGAYLIVPYYAGVSVF